jgi:hypothetical protein
MFSSVERDKKGKREKEGRRQMYGREKGNEQRGFGMKM